MEKFDHDFIKNEGRVKGSVESSDLCLRLDSFLSKVVGDSLSRTKAAEIIESGVVKVNGLLTNRASKRLKIGDSFEIDMNQIESFLVDFKHLEKLKAFSDTGNKDLIRPQNIPLDIIAEDDNLLIINKPSGMVVHPAAGNLDGTLVNAVAGHLTFNGVALPNRVGLVNRLDKLVSGIMVVAKNNKYLSLIGKQFEGLGSKDLELIKKYEDLDQFNRAEKYYNARVAFDDLKKIDRFLSGDWILLKGYIFRNPNKRYLYKFEEVLRENALSEMGIGQKLRKCVSFVRLVGVNDERKTADMEIRLVTGRTHQIRAQLAGIGLPIIGDVNYGSKVSLNEKIMLACSKLVLQYKDEGGVLLNDFNSRYSGADDNRNSVEMFMLKSIKRNGLFYLDISKL